MQGNSEARQWAREEDFMLLDQPTDRPVLAHSISPCISVSAIGSKYQAKTFSRGLAAEVLGAPCRVQSACDELVATILGLVQRHRGVFPHTGSK
jgi:hypothetical protein